MLITRFSSFTPILKPRIIPLGIHSIITGGFIGQAVIIRHSSSYSWHFLLISVVLSLSHVPFPTLSYFYCFGCGATGDVIDLVARLFNLSGYEAAKKLATDFGMTEQKPSILAKLQRGKSQAETERRCFRVLGDYLQILQDWKEHCAPQSPEDAIDPRYAEACHMLERIGNMLDILACGTPQERAEVVADLQKDERLMRMEARNRQIREESHGTK